MEQRINMLVAIAFETVVIVLYISVKTLSPFILISFFATCILMLFIARRAGIFDKTSFLQALTHGCTGYSPTSCDSGIWPVNDC